MNKNDMEKEMVQSTNVSLIVALYNFEESLKALYDAIIYSMVGLKEKFELVFIDDGSTDSTYEQLIAFAKKDKRVRIVRLRSMFGEASALDAGLKYSKYNRIVYFSGRVRANPNEIPEFLKILNEDYDLVVGWRYPRRDSLLGTSLEVITTGSVVLA